MLKFCGVCLVLNDDVGMFNGIVDSMLVMDEKCVVKIDMFVGNVVYIYEGE